MRCVALLRKHAPRGSSCNIFFLHFRIARGERGGRGSPPIFLLRLASQRRVKNIVEQTFCWVPADCAYRHAESTRFAVRPSTAYLGASPLMRLLAVGTCACLAQIRAASPRERPSLRSGYVRPIGARRRFATALCASGLLFRTEAASPHLLFFLRCLIGANATQKKMFL